MSSSHGVLPRPIQHIGYLVDDVPKAVDRWVSTFGAGPFFWLGEHIVFDETSHNGEPCVLDHSAAIGKWGPIFVELAQVHEISPPSLEEIFIGSPKGAAHPNHVSYVVEDPDAEGKRLEDLGMKKFWYARLGPIEISYYDSRDLLNGVIEVHRQSPAFDHLFGIIAAAADGWDGTNPLRHLPG